MLTLHKYGADHKISFKLANYITNGGLYVGMVCHDEEYPEPWSNLTVNLNINYKNNRAYIDTNNNGADIIFWLKENNLGCTTGKMTTSGWHLYPEFEFNMDELMKHVTRDERKFA